MTTIQNADIGFNNRNVINISGTTHTLDFTNIIGLAAGNHNAYLVTIYNNTITAANNTLCYDSFYVYNTSGNLGIARIISSNAGISSITSTPTTITINYPAGARTLSIIGL